MSNTVITNYTDLNGPSSKADSSVVVIVNKDGSLSVDQNLLGTLMGTDGSQAAGISVVRVGHEGKPEDATDSETEDDKIPHVTLSVDSYFDDPNSIIKYDSGAEMLQSLRIETRENSLVGFQNDHCYTSLTSPSQGTPQRSDSFSGYDEPVIEITHTPPPKPVPQSKKITILEQQIIPKGKKMVINPPESAIIIKGNEALNKPLPVIPKSKRVHDLGEKGSESTESSSISSGDSIPDRDSDSDYKDSKDRSGTLRSKKSKSKPRILKPVQQPAKVSKIDPKVALRLKSNKLPLKKEVKEKLKNLSGGDKKQDEISKSKESVALVDTPSSEAKTSNRPTPKILKRDKKPPAHMTALFSDMTSLFTSPDVIRRVSTDAKTPGKPEPAAGKKSVLKQDETPDKTKMILQRGVLKQKAASDKQLKGYDIIPQIDDASLAQILQDTTPPVKAQPGISAANTMNSPSLAGPLSPTLDLLGGLQPEEEGLTEDLLMHVAQLVESSENLQEVIDKQVLGKVDTIPTKANVQSPFQQAQAGNVFAQTPKSSKPVLPRKDPIEIVRRDGRVITLPPIEAPATRSSKRKSQIENSGNVDVLPTTHIIQEAAVPQPAVVTPEPQLTPVSKQYVNKKVNIPKQPEIISTPPVVDKISAESQESWNSEDDPHRLWCICRQPHNNRFMICCDSCEDWFHGKCVNITKAMGHQMEEQGIEWRCPNCTKKTKQTGTPKPGTSKSPGVRPKPSIIPQQHKNDGDLESMIPHNVVSRDMPGVSKTGCIVCKKAARASSIYCSDACILKHAQDSLGSPTKQDTEPGKQQPKPKPDSRVIVYERKTGRVLAGPNAPTAENLKSWLQKNPTFEVVRTGALNIMKPNLTKKKVAPSDQNKVQTTLNFERIPRKSLENHPTTSMPVKSPPGRTPTVKTPQTDPRGSQLLSPKEEIRVTPHPKTPISTRSQQLQYIDTPRPSTSTAKVTEPKKPVRATATRSSYDKAPVTPSTSRRKEAPDTKKKMESTEPIRDNVRKALQEQMTIRMKETTGPKFEDKQIQQFAVETEAELHELFKDVGIKYKAKYRSLMFNIKDRKNLSLWQKICDRTITPKQLVRLSPEELASQELAQWRDKEAKYQLELIKKSELDLLAASKTYVLKTHKGEEVMETKESITTELDSSVPVEDLVTALNDSIEEPSEATQETSSSKSKREPEKRSSSRKRDRGKSPSRDSKKTSRDSRHETDRKSRSSRRTETKEKMERSSRRLEKKSRRSPSKDRRKDCKEKADSSERSHRRSRSRSRNKSKRHSRSASKERERSRSRSRSRARSQSRSRRRSEASEAKRRRSSRHKHSSSTEDKVKSRSRSQDTKPKNDSTDSDSVERPKSALKDAHPEYDPHERMITSALSDEDLRKAGGDSYEDTYKSDITSFEAYDPSKPFTLGSGDIISPTYPIKDKISEVESDQEPSSTVETVWNGCINMEDVARFYVAAHRVSGNAHDLEEDLSAELDIVGRINPETVWDYIVKMRRSSNKDIIVLKLQAANDEEKMQYIALYSYLSSRNRLGVVKVTNTNNVKDFYIVPVAANSALPAVLLPLDGPGLGDARQHLLLAIVIRQWKKRPASHIPADVVPAKVARESRKRSYTPPIVSKMPVQHSYTSPALSTSVKDKIAASLAAADMDEAYSPGSSSSGASGGGSGGASGGGSGGGSGGAVAAPPPMLLSKMEELNRQIEEQKQQIFKMAQADSSQGEDEAYSPSRPMSPQPPVNPLADIALPSNLQEILATIKQRSETTTAAAADVDMRNLPLP